MIEYYAYFSHSKFSLLLLCCELVNENIFEMGAPSSSPFMHTYIDRSELDGKPAKQNDQVRRRNSNNHQDVLRIIIEPMYMKYKSNFKKSRNRIKKKYIYLRRIQHNARSEQTWNGWSFSLHSLHLQRILPNSQKILFSFNFSLSLTPTPAPSLVCFGLKYPTPNRRNFYNQMKHPEKRIKFRGKFPSKLHSFSGLSVKINVEHFARFDFNYLLICIAHSKFRFRHLKYCRVILHFQWGLFCLGMHLFEQQIFLEQFVYWGRTTQIESARECKIELL